MSTAEQFTQTEQEARRTETWRRDARRGRQGPLGEPSTTWLSTTTVAEVDPDDGSNHITDGDDDQIELFAPRLRHPLECLPYRPQPRPSWSPSRRDRRDAGKPRPVDPPERHDARLLAAGNLGAVRVNFRYASFQSMMAAHSEKAGRDQFFEGPHETYGFRLHEIDPRCVDLQYQPIELAWSSVAGVRHGMFLDWAIETEDGRVVFGEDKADDSYFEDPDLRERLDFAEQFLGANGASLERRVAGGLPTRIQRNVVRHIYNARRTEFDDAAAAKVRRLVREAGGTAPLGRVLEAIGGHPALSLEIARAMMHRRVLSMPIATPPMPDIPVTIPPDAKKGALRAFLARFVNA